jgi:hypothetical protein
MPDVTTVQRLVAWEEMEFALNIQNPLLLLPLEGAETRWILLCAAEIEKVKPHVLC